MNIERFIECTVDQKVTILIDPKSPKIHKLLQAGFAKPKLVGKNLSLTRIGGSYNYMRETVVIDRGDTILPFSHNLLNQLHEISRMAFEWGGSFVFINHNRHSPTENDHHSNLTTSNSVMQMADKKPGTENNIYVGNINRYMFHSHPSNELVPYSFFSVEDIARYVIDTEKYGTPRKDYLITDKGILSIQLSNSLIELYRKHEIVLTIVKKLQAYVIDNVLTRFNIEPDILYVVIYETIDWMNRLTGPKAISIILEKELLSVDELKQIEILAPLDRFYYVNYMEWELVAKFGFVDELY